MALYDNKWWLLSHIRHSFLLSDETGNAGKSKVENSICNMDQNDYLLQSTCSRATMTASWRGSARGWPPPTAPRTSTRQSGYLRWCYLLVVYCPLLVFVLFNFIFMS